MKHPAATPRGRSGPTGTSLDHTTTKETAAYHGHETADRTKPAAWN